jgi:glutaredoxin
MQSVDIHTTRRCPCCGIAKAPLQKKGTAFTGISLSTNGGRRNKMIVRALERAGQRDALLAGEGQTA